MNIHSAIEGLHDWWQRRQDRKFRAALRQQNRKRRERANRNVIYVDKAPDPRTVVPNIREHNK